MGQETRERLRGVVLAESLMLLAGAASSEGSTGARGSTFNEVDFSIPYPDFLQVCARGIEIVCLKKKKQKPRILLRILS